MKSHNIRNNDAGFYTWQIQQLPSSLLSQGKDNVILLYINCSRYHAFRYDWKALTEYKVILHSASFHSLILIFYIKILNKKLHQNVPKH